MMQRAYPACTLHRSQRRRRQRGQLFVVGAVLIAVLVALAGVSIDALHDIGDQQSTQAAADAAAMRMVYKMKLEGLGNAPTSTDQAVVDAVNSAALTLPNTVAAGGSTLSSAAAYTCVKNAGGPGNPLDVIFYDQTAPAGPSCSPDPANMLNKVEIQVFTAAPVPDCVVPTQCAEVTATHITTNPFASTVGYLKTTVSASAVALEGIPPKLVG